MLGPCGTGMACACEGAPVTAEAVKNMTTTENAVNLDANSVMVSPPKPDAVSLDSLARVYTFAYTEAFTQFLADHSLQVEFEFVKVPSGEFWMGCVQGDLGAVSDSLVWRIWTAGILSRFPRRLLVFHSGLFARFRSIRNLNGLRRRDVVMTGRVPSILAIGRGPPCRQTPEVRHWVAQPFCT